MADHDITKMKVAVLKRVLKIRRLKMTGNKNDLLERLASALINHRKNDEYTKFQVAFNYSYHSDPQTVNYSKRIVRPQQPLLSEMNEKCDSIGAISNTPTADVDITQTIKLNPSKSGKIIDYYIEKRETAEKSGQNNDKEYYDKLLLDLETRKFKIQADVEKFKIQVEAIKSLHGTAEELAKALKILKD
ncbi:uncharacterized protein LOC129577702 [Sitodiplosis mosellana]|uniref:uncharacterized protein LOC129577702 n=1 Tax=Sitodiplosis mosellana TaxID=263140 RepID=UPI002444BDA3|nr:uncharacterized protein LOC129577702 [Sitodiplosis mosellana]XP_055321175.1 uncharacterized protein LOC129577702 [Sitodiplosis mosellana]XP_055321176.1 uncharacterized protein LOC129577702 [Sitodiplosis mosellana]